MRKIHVIRQNAPVMSLNIEETNIKKGPERMNMKRKIKAKKARKPYCSILARKSLYFNHIAWGKKALSTLDPSSGGIGMRLKNASKIFINTMKLMTSTVAEEKYPPPKRHRVSWSAISHASA